MAINVEDVATDSDLEDELGGPGALQSITTDAERPAKARKLALEDVLAHLAARTPPITEGEIAVPSELKQVVVYGALSKLFLQNLTTGDGADVNGAKHRFYDRLYMSRLQALRPTVNTMRAAPSTIAFHRR